MASPDEKALFAEAKNNSQRSDGLMLIYLVKLDGGEIDEQPVDPGAQGQALGHKLKRDT